MAGTLEIQLLWARNIPLPLQGCMGPCFWWAPALSGHLGFILVSLMDNAALTKLGVVGLHLFACLIVFFLFVCFNDTTITH